MNKNRKCVICGASARNMNPQCDTCDPICTRAKHNNITRNEQVIRDIEEEDREYGEVNYTTPNTKKKEGASCRRDDY